MEIAIAMLLTWFAIGVASFVFWWTSDYDLTSEQAPLLFFGALMGPITFIAGRFIHGKPKESARVWLKKRG